MKTCRRLVYSCHTVPFTAPDPFRLTVPLLFGTQAPHISTCIACLDRILRTRNGFLGPFLTAVGNTEILEAPSAADPPYHATVRSLESDTTPRMVQHPLICIFWQSLSPPIAISCKVLQSLPEQLIPFSDRQCKSSAAARDVMRASMPSPASGFWPSPNPEKTMGDQPLNVDLRTFL